MKTKEDIYRTVEANIAKTAMGDAESRKRLMDSLRDATKNTTIDNPKELWDGMWRWVCEMVEENPTMAALLLYGLLDREI